jgi:hypothetical protein
VVVAIGTAEQEELVLVRHDGVPGTRKRGRRVVLDTLPGVLSVVPTNCGSAKQSRRHSRCRMSNDHKSSKFLPST